MTLILDAGALIAFERGDLVMRGLVRDEFAAGRTCMTHGGIVGQVWRSPARQVALGRLLRTTEIVPLDGALGRDVGRLLADSNTSDVIDAALVLLARDGDEIVTSDPDDLRRLMVAAAVDADLRPV